MASAYAALPDDLSSGASPLPDFEHALAMHRLLEAIKHPPAPESARR